MLAILKKEITSFFASPVGYLVIAIFLVLNGLFLWVFDGEYNILNSGFADLTAFFRLSPWILLFLIPAVTMKSFTDEKKLGTLELLFTRPLNAWQIVLGKYGGAFALTVIALLPTLLYVLTVWKLGNPEGNLDTGSIAGSYFGLLFLVLSYTAIGIFASTLSGNQIVAFLVSVFVCFCFYYGFEGLSALGMGEGLSALGMKAHFDSISRGVLDTRDILYFLSVAFFFLYITVVKLKNTRNR